MTICQPYQTRVPRFVRKVLDAHTKLVENPIESLDRFRSNAAWVLLGEPGAGKTTTFEMEAEAISGEYLRLDEFTDLDIESNWQGKTLFLDSLDEVRAGTGGNNILLRVRRQLKRLGNPSFRIACRAVDWYGSTDRVELESASPNNQITVLLLEPLSDENILTLLRKNYSIDDPQAFVVEAEKRGVAALLDNPQTLELLVKAVVGGGRWPKTRDETYQLACEQLAIEANKRHRDKKRTTLFPIEKVLDAAGQLYAVLLFSNKTGLALDPASANERFPDLADYGSPHTAATSQAIGSNLFRPEGEERVVPRHRSIAEYLAARWLGRRIDKEGLPLRRVLNLLLGADGGVVAGLRGLFGWLALHCLNARLCLINADPLTVIVYGDVKPMPVADKRRILAGLRREAERYTAFRRDVLMAHPFGALADVELRDDFLSILQATERDEPNQSFADCVLTILTHGEAQPEFALILLDIVRDDTRWLAVRKDALKAWLKLSINPQEALNLLDDVTEGRVTDHDDELTGTLLRHLYPMHLDPKMLLRYLHTPKNSTLLGTYYSFWRQEVPELTPQENLPILLDEFVGHPEIVSCDLDKIDLLWMIGTLLVQGITIHGDSISGDRLFAWLGIGIDEFGSGVWDKNDYQIIIDWLDARPERYKAILALCFWQNEQHRYPYFHIQTSLYGAKPPEDLGLWHLEQATLANNEEFIKMHLTQAVIALAEGRGACGLSLDHLEAWSAAHPERKHWLDSMLICDIPEWRIQEATRRITRKQKHIEDRKDRTIAVAPYLSAIRTGSARVDLMNQLAGVYKRHFIGGYGETPDKIFENFYENGSEILAAAEAGFRLCPERPDLPTVEEIIHVYLKQKGYVVQLPCLIGMELRWQNGPGEVECLSDETLCRIIAFRLTYGVGNSPEWFTHLVRQRAALVAEVFIAYASTTLEAGKDHIDSIDRLERDPEYRAVAILAAPRLLETFPVRARTGQLRYLKNLLKAALRYTPAALQPLIERKLGRKGMNIAQKVYWHVIATLLDPTSYEAMLWRYVGKSKARTIHLAEFLSHYDDQTSQDYELSSNMMGKLIELITPHAEMKQANGVVTDTMRHGDLVRALITHLGKIPELEAAQELNRLLDLPALRKLKPAIESACHQQKLRQRESQFSFLSPVEVAQILANQAPTNAADLAALALDHLDDIARELRQDNDDGLGSFWNVEKKQATNQREENLCRNALLTRLRAHLNPLGIDCQPEADYANDKRADIRLSYCAEYELPIEIKRDSNKSLWTALRDQLIDQYTIAPRADGYGIYLVFWFGGNGMPRATDGEKKPCSPEELKTRLEAQLSSTEQKRVFIRVLDVSWPVNNLKSGCTVAKA